MISIFFMLVVLLPVFSGFGTLLAKLTGSHAEEITAKLLMGIFCVSIIYIVLAFFIPLTVVVEIAFIFSGLLLFFYYKIYNQFCCFFLANKLLFPLIGITVLFFGAFYPFVLDHFGYYVPTVQWISQFGLVRGISNLDLLLGQMSVWHILQAGFSGFADTFLRLNVLVLVVYLVYIFEKKSWVHLILLPFLFLLSQSPSPDLPVIVFFLILLAEIFSSKTEAGQLFAFSVFIFAIKPTMIWVPIFTFIYILWFKKGNLKVTFFGVFVLILFVLKNMWTFGFPVFPVKFLDLGVSWQPNAQLLQNSAEMAVMKTYDMQYSFGQIQKFSNLEAVRNWLFLPGMKGKINLLLSVSLLVFLFYSIRKKSKLIWILFIAIVLKTAIVLHFSAQYRFFLDVFFVIFFIIFKDIITKKNALILFSVLSLFFAAFLSFPTSIKQYVPSFRLGTYMMGFSRNQFYQPSIFQLKKYRTYQIGNLKFNAVEKYPFSFDTPLPAISPQFLQEDLDAGIFPQMKGRTFQEGFIWRKINKEEKKKLQLILKGFHINNESAQ